MIVPKNSTSCVDPPLCDRSGHIWKYPNSSCLVLLSRSPDGYALHLTRDDGHLSGPIAHPPTVFRRFQVAIPQITPSSDRWIHLARSPSSYPPSTTFDSKPLASTWKTLSPFQMYTRSTTSTSCSSYATYSTSVTSASSSRAQKASSRSNEPV